MITGLIQSSTGTTVLVVGLVRAGLMTLPQAVGVIFGANIGTTITSVLIGLKISDYALPIMFVGSFLAFFIQRKKIKELGKVIIGFGMLFFGLEIMGDALKQLVQLPEFQAMLLSVAEHPILGVLVGASARRRSSNRPRRQSDLLQQLFATGGVPLVGAVAIVLGDNIGTTVTAVFASIGGSTSSKRAALRPRSLQLNRFDSCSSSSSDLTTALIGKIRRGRRLDPAYLSDRLTVSFAHVAFNLVNTFVMYWFIKQLVWLVTKLVPAEFEIEVAEVTSRTNSLDQRIAGARASKTRNAQSSTWATSRKAMFDATYRFALEYNPKLFEFGMQCEELIDTLGR
ncbi:MAG: Na/Pi symporter [Bacillus subtilis]|nr:Na/Pi symporter [Bacillus subtilis]